MKRVLAGDGSCFTFCSLVLARSPSSSYIQAQNRHVQKSPGQKPNVSPILSNQNRVTYAVLCPESAVREWAMPMADVVSVLGKPQKRFQWLNKKQLEASSHGWFAWKEIDMMFWSHSPPLLKVVERWCLWCCWLCSIKKIYESVCITIWNCNLQIDVDCGYFPVRNLCLVDVKFKVMMFFLPQLTLKWEFHTSAVIFSEALSGASFHEKTTSELQSHVVCPQSDLQEDPKML